VREPPWRENPYGLVTWWDVEAFAAEDLHAVLSALENVRNQLATVAPPGDAPISRLLGQKKTLNDADRQALQGLFVWMERGLRGSGLPASAEALSDLGETIKTSKRELLAETIGHDLEELQKTIRREMRTVVFLYVPAEGAKGYREPLDGWESVADRWPETKKNISESSVCLALGRYGGAVFHVLLVAEFGAIQVCNLLGVSGDRPGWGCVDRLEKILDRRYPDRSILEQQHSDLLRDVVPKLVSLKATRHQITHTDNSDAWIVQDIGPSTADEVIKSARWFMREIAARIPKVS